MKRERSREKTTREGEGKEEKKGGKKRREEKKKEK